MSKMADGLITVTIAGTIILAIGMAGESDLQEEVSQVEQYCAMVQRYQETAGREGWPDYKSTYSELCDN